MLELHRARTLVFAQNAKRVMSAALHDAQSSGEDVDTSHLLARILATDDEAIDDVLAASNVDRGQARRRAQDLIDASQPVRTARVSPSKPQIADTGEALIRRMVHRHDALVAALRRYGRHDNDCLAPSAPCACGLSTALLVLETDDDH